MYLLIESIEIQSNSFFTFPSFSSFMLHISNGHNHEAPIKLNCKSTKLNYLIPLTSQKIKIELDFKRENPIIFNFELQLGKKHKQHFNEKKWHGYIIFKCIQNCLFMYLENIYIKKNNGALIKKYFSKSMVHNQYKDKRILYDGTVYELDNYKMSFFIGVTSYPDLPKGWEMKFYAGKPYFVNHNKNYTQWEHPADSDYLKGLSNKMVEYQKLKNLSEFALITNFRKVRIDVRRDFIVQSSYAQIISLKRDYLKGVWIKYMDEIGEDYGAILKDFFCNGSLELIKDKRIVCQGNVFDVCEIDEHKNDYNNNVEIKFTDEFYCEANKGKNCLSDQDFFIYLGAFIGLVIFCEESLPIDFSLGFYENLLTRNFTLQHIQDEVLQKNLNYALKADANVVEILDENLERLTNENKLDYVNRNINYHLFDKRKQHYEWVRKGFRQILHDSVEKTFTCYDFSKLISGPEELTFEMLKQTFRGEQNIKEVKFLLDILKRKDEEFLRKFLQFVTGSQSFPIYSLETRTFEWSVYVYDVENKLFHSSACNNKLFIGKYKDVNTMERIMEFSILNTVGFHKA